MIATPFLRQWGAPILAALLAIGLGLGAWAFIDSINDDRRRLEEENQTLKSEKATLELQAVENAGEIGSLRTRLELERQLYDERIAGKEERAELAEQRSNRLSGEINALGRKLDEASCPGVSGAIVDGLSDNAAERDARRRSREDGIRGIAPGSVQGPLRLNGANSGAADS